MSVINELIRTEANGTLSFGNYSLAAKSKVEDFEHEGDLYKVKTFKEITKLEDGVGVGGMKTNMSGKLSLSVELNEGKEVEVKIVRK